MARLVAPELDDVWYLSLSAISTERIAPELLPQSRANPRDL
jgi:hypothetical protein